MPTLKQVIAGGQYEYPKGLFFGGKQFEEGPLKYQTYVAEHLATVKRMVVIDVHTGLGPFGKDTLLVEADHEGSPLYYEMCDAFGERVAPLDADRSVTYPIRGSHRNMFQRLVPEAKVYFVTQEFGTYNSTKMLQALREENRWQIGRASGRERV